MYEISLKGYTLVRRNRELGQRWEEDYFSLYILLNLSNIKEDIQKYVNQLRGKH